MNFRFLPKRRDDRRTDAPTFTVERLLADVANGPTDLSHLIDRSYPYRSVRELKWHLADRFGVPLAEVAVARA